MNRKVTVVGGAGNVGMTVARAIAEKELADVVIIDIAEQKAAGVALDIYETCPVIGSDSRVIGGADWSTAAGSDIVVITSGKPRKPGMSRDDLVRDNFEIMKSIAEHRGAAGYVIDGAIRDVAAFAASDFPCFARAVIHRGPYKSGPGEINVPVSIGGAVISPGDIVVGDEDGVVSFSQAAAPALLEAVKAQIAREEATLVSIREGRYQGSYGKS